MSRKDICAVRSFGFEKQCCSVQPPTKAVPYSWRHRIRILRSGDRVTGWMRSFSRDGKCPIYVSQQCEDCWLLHAPANTWHGHWFPLSHSGGCEAGSDCVLLDTVLVHLTSVHHSAKMSPEQRNKSPPVYRGIEFHNTSNSKAPCTHGVHPRNLGLAQLGKINVIRYIDRIKEKSPISRWAEKKIVQNLQVPC